MSTFPTSFVSHGQTLTDQALDEVSQANLQQLSANGYEAQLGLAPDIVDQIKQISLEPLMRDYVPRDADERFKDTDAAEKWLGKGRAVFLLFKKNDDGLNLIGYGWAGPGTSELAPGGQTTWAVRIGQAGQGQGLATPFSSLIINVSANFYAAKNFWLETWASNGAAVHIYHKMGFKDIAQEPARRPTSAGPVEDTRLYMSLDNELLPKNDTALSANS